MWVVSLTHPFLASFFDLGSFSYTSCADFLFMWGVSHTHPMLASFFLMWGVSLTHPMLTLFLCGEILLHIPCWLHFYLGSFSYTSRAVFIFSWGVSLTHPMLTFFLCGEFFLHIPGCIDVYARSFSYTSRAETKCTKTALSVSKKGGREDTQAKEQARAEKAHK